MREDIRHLTEEGHRELGEQLAAALNMVSCLTADDYLLAAWQRNAPGAAVERGFPTGFWPDVARTAVELALAGDLDAPLSFRPTLCTSGSDYEEGRAVSPHVKKVKGIEVSKLEFKL